MNGPFLHHSANAWPCIRGAGHEQSHHSSTGLVAQASSERTRIGGYLPELRPDGALKKRRSRWFSGTRSRELAVNIRAGKQAVSHDIYPRILGGPDESEVVLQRAPSGPPHNCTGRFDVGNGSAPNQLMTTSFPSSAVLRERADTHHQKVRGMGVGV